MSSHVWTLQRLGYAEPNFALQPHLQVISIGRSLDCRKQLLGNKMLVQTLCRQAFLCKLTVSLVKNFLGSSKEPKLLQFFHHMGSKLCTVAGLTTKKLVSVVNEYVVLEQECASVQFQRSFKAFLWRGKPR